ncbi:MAG: 4-(cytidine 5'-diphospho)-2-C-methyl-D-erythritol kinase [Pseudomonadota bacterium]|jgi:4-diphosphocytidyl-2-C-methyl-D-erythritol kinase
MAQLIEAARAKVNLTLRVLGRRADGYHDLESLVAFADCADTLTLMSGDRLGLTMTGPRAAECGGLEDNLVTRVAAALAERVDGLRTGHFTLDKHLPVAAGIGGGSADAAAALRLLARANNLDLADPRIADVARETGADIPVCVASKACLMAGIGEELTPLPLPAMFCVMVNPRVGVATRDVFTALGLKNGELLVGATDVMQALQWPEDGAGADAWIEVVGSGINDLEKPALEVQPLIGDVLDALRDAEGAQFARMSGSGATCFAIFKTGGAAQKAAAAIQQAHPGWWVHAGVLS